MPKRKWTVDECVLEPDMSLAMLANIGARLEGNQITQKRKKQVYEDLRAEVSRCTPFGPLLTVMDIETNDGKNLKWTYIDPLALIYELCRLNAAFALLLRSLGPSLSIAGYSDDTTPGNQLRPDVGKSLQTYYWCFCEVPEHIRCRTWGWFPIGR